jgi:hypothetical protein
MRSTHLRLALVLGAVCATSCASNTIYGGAQTYDHFPVDGERSWEYKDDSRKLTLLVEKGSSTTVDGAEKATLEYSDRDAGDLMMEIDWTSDVSTGVIIYGYRTFANFDALVGKGAALKPEDVTFDPPVQFMGKYMETGDVLETSTGGFDFVSTFTEVTGCPTIWSDEWSDADCYHFVLEDGDDDPNTNGPIVGEYWTLPRWGAALFQVDYFPTLWNLSMADWNATKE